MSRPLRNRSANGPVLPRRRWRWLIAPVLTVALVALALVGPTGVRAWSDSHGLLEQRQAELATLRAERDRVANRVHLLDPDNADPDLVGELLRDNLNVAHPDEVVVPREDASR